MDLPQEVVSKMFIATDNREWDKAIDCFSSKVEVDYSSFTKNPGSIMTPEELIGVWKTVLPGFECTHHQIGNIITSIDLLTAHVFCYGIMLHYLEGDNGHVWTVVGSYDFDLVKDMSDSWYITKMQFNFKYQDGNTVLPQKAMIIVKEMEENK